MKTRIIRNHEQLLSACTALAEIPDESLPIEITVDHHKNTPTSQQYRLMGEIIGQIRAYYRQYKGVDYSTEVWLEFFRDLFIPKTIVTIDGNPKVIPTSTKIGGVSGMNDFIMNLQSWAAEHEIQLELLE